MSRKHPAAQLAAKVVDGRLFGAACVGRHALFDAEIPGETGEQRAARITIAAQICSTCRVRRPCRDVADELGTYAEGVWAGRDTKETP